MSPEHPCLGLWGSLAILSGLGQAETASKKPEDPGSKWGVGREVCCVNKGSYSRPDTLYHTESPGSPIHFWVKMGI
ncbi:hypothetical protein COT47_07230 [Candidatus Woesearchaeota archaeon CG08_land_8_20_14_0_20_43_7]|nr:MAG: hypothetical protein COT47_07230 [Candidatus Woesearchaeota archaeon CG08_land_8_20_14_0_20_43_7]